MKKKLVLPYLLIFSGLFLPVLTLILYCFGYKVSLISYPVFSVVLALLYFVSTYVICKKNIICKALAFLPIISLVNLAVYAFKARQMFVFACMTFCFLCSAVIAEKVCKTTKTKVASVITSMILPIPILLAAFAAAALDGFSITTVYDRIYSPNKSYYAEIVDYDEGTFGRETIVDVYRNNGVNLIFLRIRKYPQRVYSGIEDCEDIRAEWKDEKCLIIYSDEYKIEI